MSRCENVQILLSELNYLLYHSMVKMVRQGDVMGVYHDTPWASGPDPGGPAAFMVE